VSTIYLNGDWWYYQTYLTNLDGKKIRVQKSLGTKDKKEGRVKQKDLDDKYLVQQIHLISRTVFQEKVDEFLVHRRQLRDLGELTTNTIRSDVGSIKIFSSFFHKEGHKYLNEFDNRDKSREILEKFISTRRSENRSPNTIRRDLRHLSGLFSYYVSSPRRLLQFNPVSEVSLPKPTRQSKFPDQKDWLTLRSFLRKRMDDNDSTQFQQIVWFQIETGTRIGEVLRLKWKRDSSDRIGTGESWSVPENRFRQIRIYSKKRERVIPIQKIFNGRLTKFLTNRKKTSTSDYVFPSPVTDKPLNCSQFSRSFKTQLKSLKITKLFGTHGVRHGFISYLLNQGVSSDQIGWLVGHSSSEITKIYSHPDPDSLSRILGGLK
jgi:site-specific recombinase XerD